MQYMRGVWYQNVWVFLQLWIAWVAWIVGWFSKSSFKVEFQNVMRYSTLQEIQVEPIPLSQDIELFNVEAYKVEVLKNIAHQEKAMKTFPVARKFAFLFNTQIETTGAQPNYILWNLSSSFWFAFSFRERDGPFAKNIFIYVVRCRRCRCGERKVQKHVAIVAESELASCSLFMSSENAMESEMPSKV